VEYDLQPIPEQVVWENVIIKESMWAYPREHSAKQKMRECYANYDEAMEVAAKLKARLIADFTADQQNAKMIEVFCNALNMTSEPLIEQIVEFG
jgi:hypothetical protein